MVEEVISEVWLTHAVNNATTNRLDTGLHVICTTNKVSVATCTNTASHLLLRNSLFAVVHFALHTQYTSVHLLNLFKKTPPRTVNKVSLKLSWCYSHFWKYQKWSKIGCIVAMATSISQRDIRLDTRILAQLMSLSGADIRLKHTREYQRRASSRYPNHWRNHNCFRLSVQVKNLPFELKCIVCIS